MITLLLLGTLASAPNALEELNKLTLPQLREECRKREGFWELQKASLAKNDDGRRQIQSKLSEMPAAQQKALRDFLKGYERERPGMVKAVEGTKNRTVFCAGVLANKAPIDSEAFGWAEAFLRANDDTNMGAQVLTTKLWDVDPARAAKHAKRMRRGKGYDEIRRFMTDDAIRCYADDDADACVATCTTLPENPTKTYRLACAKGLKVVAVRCTKDQDEAACKTVCELKPRADLVEGFAKVRETGCRVAKQIVVIKKTQEVARNLARLAEVKLCESGELDACVKVARRKEEADPGAAFAEYLRVCELGHEPGCAEAKRTSTTAPERLEAWAGFVCNKRGPDACLEVVDDLRAKSRHERADVIHLALCERDDRQCAALIEKTRSRSILEPRCPKSERACERLRDDYERGELGDKDAAAGLKMRKTLCQLGQGNECFVVAKLLTERDPKEGRAFEREVCARDQEDACERIKTWRKGNEPPSPIGYRVGAGLAFDSNPYRTNADAMGEEQGNFEAILFPAIALNLNGAVGGYIPLSDAFGFGFNASATTLSMLQLGSLPAQRGGNLSLLGGGAAVGAYVQASAITVGDSLQLSLLPGRQWIFDDVSVPLGPTVVGDTTRTARNIAYAKLRTGSFKVDYDFTIERNSDGPLVDEGAKLGALFTAPWFGAGTYGIPGDEGFADRDRHRVRASYVLEEELAPSAEVGAAFDRLGDRTFIPFDGQVGFGLYLDEVQVALKGGFGAVVTGGALVQPNFVGSGRVSLDELGVELAVKRQIVILPTLEPSMANTFVFRAGVGDGAISVTAGGLEWIERSGPAGPYARTEEDDVDGYATLGGTYPLLTEGPVGISGFADFQLFFSAADLVGPSTGAAAGSTAEHWRAHVGVEFSLLRVGPNPGGVRIPR